MAALAALLLLGLSVVAPSPAQAAQGNFGVYLTGRARPAEFLAALRFRDLPAGPAAAPLLRLAAQGVLHGDGSGRIYPDAVISRQEAIVALVRLLGLEGEAVAGTTRTSSTLAAASGGGGAAWAQGYIAAADVHGLTGASGTRGTLAQPAANGAAETPWDAPLTREEAAAWAVRALDPSGSAGSGGGLLATYTDGGRVSPELQPLVERALELGLISGPSPDHLAPQGSLTRAQLAALLDSLGRRLPPGPGAVWQLGTLSRRLDENEDLGGRAVRATTWEITDPSGSATALKFTATSAGTPLQGAVVLRAGRLALSDTLLAGEAVRYLITGDGVVPFIEVLPGTIASTAGIITGLEPTAGRLVLSDASGLVHTFTFQPQTVVSVGGQAATPQDLAVGQRVSVRGLAGAAWEVAALPDESDAGTPLPAGTVRGQVRYRDEKRLVLTLVGGVEAEYAVSTGTQVLARGRTSDLSAVQPGDQVELTLGGTDGTWAERISVSGPAGRVAALYRGRLGTFAPRGDTLLLTQPKRLEGSAWQDAGAANLSLALSPDATLWLDGKPVDLTTAARYSGSEAYAAVGTGFGRPEALQVVIKTGLEQAYEGRIKQVNPALGEVELAAGTIALSPGAIVIKEGRLADAYALTEDDSVQALVAKGAGGGLGLVVSVLGPPEALPETLTVYKGQVDEVGTNAWTLDHYYTLNENEWDYHGRSSSDDLSLSRDTLILSLLGAQPQVLTPAEFRQGLNQDLYNHVTALAVTSGTDTLGLALWPEDSLGSERLSAGRVARLEEGAGGTTLALAEARDFSPAKNAWQTTDSLQQLTLKGTLVVKRGRAATWEELAVGDTVDVLRRGQQGLLILVKE